MGFYFNKQGKFKFRNYFLLTAALGWIGMKRFYFNIYRIKDDSMLPFFKKGEIVFCNNYFWNCCKRSHGSSILKHKLIAVKNPSNGETLIRRMMGNQSEWVIRADNGTFR